MRQKGVSKSVYKRPNHTLTRSLDFLRGPIFPEAPTSHENVNRTEVAGSGTAALAPAPEGLLKFVFQNS
jgi:hypothetical protein